MKTKKYLFKLEDDNYIEAVLMKHNYGNSLCISTQVGCNMGCKFCESGRLKKVRDLDSSEFILQILRIEEYIKTRISHIVVMGIGEPFDNYINLTKFIEIVNYPKGINLGSRHITVSTCGVVPKIKDFSNFPYQVNLAISLHAPNNELRSKLMKINKAYNIEDEINNFRNLLRNSILEQIDKKKIEFQQRTLFMEIINECERIGDYVINVLSAMPRE